MGMRTAGNLPFVELKYFVLSHQSWYIQMYKKTPEHTHTYVCIIGELHHFKGFNLRAKQTAGGGKLEGAHGHFIRGRGSTLEEPLISRRPSKPNTQKETR